MSENLMTSKRAARIERRKSRVAAIFQIGSNEAKDGVQSLNENEEKEGPAVKQPRLSDEDYLSLKMKLREKKRFLQNSPQFRLIDLGLNASLNLPKVSRIPVLVTDVQTLFLFTVVGDSSCYQPYKWCSLTKWNNLTQTLVLIVDNVSVDDLENNKEIFSESFRIFEDGVEMNNSNSDGFSLDLALAYVPISNGMKKRVLAGYPSLEAACKDRYIYGLENPLFPSNETKNIKKKLSTKLDKASEQIPSIQLQENNEESNEQMQKEGNIKEAAILQKGNECRNVSDLGNLDAITSKMERTGAENTRLPLTDIVDSEDLKAQNLEEKHGCSRCDLLLSASQLIAEQYPLPGYEEYKKYSFTQEKYEPVTDRSPMFSIDCEWCTCIDGSYGLARVAVVDEELKTVYHTYVKPDVTIFDYLTKYSGITEDLLKDVKKTPLGVQQDLQKLLPPDSILVGQSLNSDLKALKLIHPYCIDTSVIYNLTGARSFKSKLKVLAAAFCGRSIQDSSNGHDPTEDAIAAMELVLFKLKMGVEFGDVILSKGVNWEVPINDSLSHSLIFQSIGGKRQRNCDDVFVDQDSPIHMKLFTFIQSHNKSAALITTHPSLEKSYRPELFKINKAVIRSKKTDESLAGPAQILAAHDLRSAITATSTSRFNNSFTLVHTSIEDQSCKQKWKELDSAIAELYGGVSINGMMILILGGKNSPMQNGVCLVRVKRRK